MVMGSSYFVKTLSKTDVGKRLALLTKYMKHLPCIPCGHPVANLLEVMDVHGTEWYLGYTFRRLARFCEMQMSHTRRSDHISERRTLMLFTPLISSRNQSILRLELAKLDENGDGGELTGGHGCAWDGVVLGLHFPSVGSIL
ncbi:hypothetical protein GOBAR_DD11036 [Gossypium barbadense]|nr:hypothetical protein GOBAR_DD11036 [Gossypium barbadense]